MSSANNTNDGIDVGGMKYQGLPPIPEAGKTGADVCAIVRLYLAVIDDLTPQQVELLSEHVVTCIACGEVFETMERATHLVGGTATSVPSPRIDETIFALVENSRGGLQTRRQPVNTNRILTRRSQRTRRRKVVNILGELVAAAVILLALFTSLHLSGIFGAGGSPQFALPASLSWSQYVLYHSETRTATSGELYHVVSYDDLGTGNMHVETKMDKQLDVVAVANGKQILGEDTIHHVAQLGAAQWLVDDSLFNLSELRDELQSKQATYLGTDTFKGQSVYRIRCSNGLVMLLDMHYLPVNVLRGALGPGTGYPIYTDLKLLPAAQMSDSIWDMSVPLGYHMGTLPPQP